MTIEQSQARNVFTRERKSFRMMGTDYQFEFIPSEHFQSILMDVLNAVLKAYFLLEDGSLEKQNLENLLSDSSTLMQYVKDLLINRIYFILLDVLVYQNNAPDLTITDLRKRTSPLEIATFTELLLTDPEIGEAVLKYVSGLGKFTENLPTDGTSRLTSLLQTAKSTQS